MNALNFRTFCMALFGFSVIATVVAVVYFQNHLQLEPCPLCIFQRIGVWTMGAFALLGMLINPKALWGKLVL